MSKRQEGDAEERRRTFRCNVCRRRVPWDFGCDDDMPGACDDCWAAAHGFKRADPINGASL